MVRSLLDLSPTEFENLTFDLLQAAGLINLVWRTPGADGGRDLEGVYATVDFAGYYSTQNWYAECKRYEGSVDWPTVWSKISYADSHKADFLLLVTTSTPSPTCETQIGVWNSTHRTPKVRVWRGYELDQILRTYPAVATKYGLREIDGQIDAQFLPVLQELMKISQAGYAALELGRDPSPPLEAAAALSELVSLRMDQIRRFGHLVTEPAQADHVDYAWAKWTGDDGQWEQVGLRALLAVYRYVVASQEVQVVGEGQMATLSPLRPRLPATPAAFKTFSAVALWANIEVSTVSTPNGVVTIRSRLTPEGQR